MGDANGSFLGYLSKLLLVKFGTSEMVVFMLVMWLLLRGLWWVYRFRLVGLVMVRFLDSHGSEGGVIICSRINVGLVSIFPYFLLTNSSF